MSLKLSRKIFPMKTNNINLMIMKEVYLNLLITLALITYLLSLSLGNGAKTFMEGIAYGICFGGIIYFINHLKMFISKNEQ